jgi:acetyl esterase/lipase
LWSFSFEVIVRMLRADWESSADWPLERIREASNAGIYPSKHARLVTTRSEPRGGVPCHTFTPSSPRGSGKIVYFHGGSYFYGSCLTTHRELVAGLAHDCALEVVGVEYRLVPEHTYPAQLEDALAVVDALVAAGTAPERIVLAGDSAGGNLVLSAARALRDRGITCAGLVLLSPWGDLTMPGASYTENDATDFGTRDALVRHAEAFAKGIPLDDARISPIFADLAGLPATLVVLGTAEIPRDDIRALAKKLAADGVDVTVHEAQDMPHNAAVFADYHREGARAFRAIIDFVTKVLPS